MAASSQPTSPFSDRQILEAHLKEKAKQFRWLGLLYDVYFKEIEASKSISRFEDFPFECPLKRSKVKIVPIGNPIVMTKGDYPFKYLGRPSFVISIPCHKASRVFLKEMIRKIEDELYGSTPEESREAAKDLVSIVIGVNNCYKAYDQKAIREFNDQVENLRERCQRKPLSRVVSVSILPFFWEYSWESKERGVPIRGNFSISKCYMIANSYFRFNFQEQGDLWVSKAFTKQGGPKRDTIPYQKIRDTILHSPSLIHELKRSRSRQSYVLSLDCDFSSLRSSSSQKGLLSHYEAQIVEFYKKKGSYPDVISSGYEAPETEQSALIKEGIKLDRMIRSSISAKFVYMPEPNMAFRIQRVSDLTNKNCLSWQSSDTGMHTESRRLLSNGLKKGMFDSKKFLFVKEGAVQTEIDEDWRTSTTERFRNLTPYAYTLPEVQKGFRHIHQSFAKPQVWATNVYTALGIKVKKYMEDAISPLKQIREAYDPISLQKELPSSIPRTIELMEEALSIYLIYNDTLTYCANEDITVEETLDYFYERLGGDYIHPRWRDAISKQIQKLKQALATLKKSYKENEKTEILGAASNTGWSITEFYYKRLGLTSGYYVG